MKVEKIYTKYILTNNDYSIEAKIGKDRIDIIRTVDMRNAETKCDFRFYKSKPEVAENVIKLMARAVKLSKE